MRNSRLAGLVGMAVALAGWVSLAQEQATPGKEPPAKKQPSAEKEPPPSSAKNGGSDKKKEQKKAAIALKVGDAAPALKADKWLQGDQVSKFEEGKTYVVEFWATWCGPCIVMMPHMSELQAQYKNQGVTFIGYSAKDSNNTEEKVAAFVKKRGPKLAYTFAFADDRDTYNAWMRAAGRTGIPCCFVVDKAGKVAYIGHPMYLDVVLPKVVDGSWKGQESVEEVAAIEKEVGQVFSNLRSDGDEGLKVLTEFNDKHPELSKIPYFVGPKIAMLLRAKKSTEAVAYASSILDTAVKQEDPSALRTISTALRGPEAQGAKDCLDLALRAADALLKVSGPDDALALYNLAETQFALGQRDKAKELGAKAIAAADSPALKKSLEQRVKRYEADEPKPDKPKANPDK